MDAGRELDALVATKILGGFVASPDAMADKGEVWFWLHPKDGVLIGEPYKVGVMKRWDHQWRQFKPSADIADAWLVVEKMRDMWTAATEGASGLADDFTHPFDDAYFFDSLRRNADRRWPWAFLYVTPEAICFAALRAVGVELP